MTGADLAAWFTRAAVIFIGGFFALGVIVGIIMVIIVSGWPF